MLEAVARGWRCLVCAPSNVAVDGILERLVAAGDGTRGGGGVNGSGGRESGRPRVVRMGHPARLLPQVRERVFLMCLYIIARLFVFSVRRVGWFFG